VNATLSRLTATAVRAAAAFAAALTLASCGGGGVSANPSPIVDSPTLTILPATAIMYSGMPTTFVFSGGTGAYIIASSDQAVLPAIGGVTGRSVTLVPNTVVAETTVTLTLRDTGSAAPVTATVTVRPGTVNNNITITPSSTQSADCSPAICSGGDAEVRVTVSQGSIPLPARGIRFDVVSGSFNFIISAPGLPEQVASSHVVVTDETGVARARMRVTAGAANQTALLQVTDLGTGAFRQTSFAIAQFNGNAPAFFTLPSSITYTGPYANVCASSSSTQIAIFGGTPPYNITGGGSGYSVSPAVVGVSGGSFTLSLFSTPVCIENAAIGVTDATGRTTAVTFSSVTGTGAAPAPGIALFPSTLALACSVGTTAVTSSVSIVGGSGTFSASSNHPRVTATVSGRTVTLQRLAGDGATTYPTSGNLSVTDGNSLATASFTVPANCPSGSTANPFTVTPSSGTVDGSLTSPGVNLLLSGGSGTYTISFVSDPRIVATVFGSTLNIDTATSCPVPATAISAFVVISDGATTQTVPVTGNVCGGVSPTPFAVSPTSATVIGTTGSLGVNLLLSGGSGSYSVTFISDPRITASVTGSGSTLNIRTTFTCAAPAINLPASVNVSDGATTLTVPVNATVCP